MRAGTTDPNALLQKPLAMFPGLKVTQSLVSDSHKRIAGSGASPATGNKRRLTWERTALPAAAEERTAIPRST